MLEPKNEVFSAFYFYYPKAAAMAKREKRNLRKGSVGNNRKQAEDFFDKNRIKPGVVETESGLQYLVFEEGEGEHPAPDAFVTVHQRVLLLNGNVIGDTFKENKPEEVSMKEMIEGYSEGIQLMKKGARFKLFVPPELAWGKKGTGNKIPPNATLIFDVRLLDFW